MFRKGTYRFIHTLFSNITPEFTTTTRHFQRRFQNSFSQLASSDPLGDVTPILFPHRIAESVSPLNLILLGIICGFKIKKLTAIALNFKFFVIRNEQLNYFFLLKSSSYVNFKKSIWLEIFLIELHLLGFPAPKFSSVTDFKTLSHLCSAQAPSFIISVQSDV